MSSAIHFKQFLFVRAFCCTFGLLMLTGLLSAELMADDATTLDLWKLFENNS